MIKLKLDLTELRVESFEAGNGRPVRRGTVRGQVVDCTAYDSCWCETGPAECEYGPETNYSCQSNIIACPIIYTDGSCAGDACYYSDAHTCDVQCTDWRTCNYCP